MQKNVKYYATEYQKGNIEALDELITSRLSREQGKDREDYIERLRFNDKALDSIYLKLCSKFRFMDYKDIDHYMYQAFFDVKEDGTVTSVFDNVDVTRTPQEVLKFVERKLYGNIINQIEKEPSVKSDKDKNKDKPIIEYDEQNLSTENFGDDEEQDGTFKLSDKAMADEYTSVDNGLKAYQEFIDYVGGNIKNILSRNQQFMYDLIQDTSLTEEDVAKEYDCSQQNVNDMRKAISKRIKKKYFEFMTIKKVSSNRDTYRIINGFLQQHQQIITYDITDSFDYFGYFINFLNTYYRENEQEIDSEYLHKNKVDYSLSVLDVVVDYVNVNTYKIVQEYIFNTDSNLKLTQRQKDSFVMNVVKGFNKYTADVNKAVSGLSDRVAKENESQKYIDLLM